MVVVNVRNRSVRTRTFILVQRSLAQDWDMWQSEGVGETFRGRVEKGIGAWDHRSHTEVGMKLYHKWELSQLGWTAVPLWRWKRPLELELLSHRRAEQLSPLSILPLFLHDYVVGGNGGQREGKNRKAPQSHLKALSSPSLSFGHHWSMKRLLCEEAFWISSS